MQNQCNSVRLIEERCIGCTDCIKRCPTEAIRVRNGKAVINSAKCIDCGMCIRVCSSHAKQATTDPISRIANYKYKVALVAPSILSQFKHISDTNLILTAIKHLDFDDVFEVSKSAEIVTRYSILYEKVHTTKKPLISSACPATVRLICMRFPSLIPNILPILSPMEVAARLAKEYVTETEHLRPEEIGVFFISPCGAKASNVQCPMGIKTSYVDGVISFQEVYTRILSNIKSIQVPEKLTASTHNGIEWAAPGGESKNLKMDNAISVDGVENIISVLEAVENGQLDDIDFIEALSCTGGCIGGPLTVENCFVAKNNFRKSMEFVKKLPLSERRDLRYPNHDIDFEFTEKIEPIDVLKLDDDIHIALQKLEEMSALHAKLPLIDCGSCGAPTCNALAEDIVRGEAQLEDCIFMLRAEMFGLAEEMLSLAHKLPQSLSRRKEASHD